MYDVHMKYVGMQPVVAIEREGSSVRDARDRVLSARGTSGRKIRPARLGWSGEDTMGEADG